MWGVSLKLISHQGFVMSINMITPCVPLYTSKNSASRTASSLLVSSFSSNNNNNNNNSLNSNKIIIKLKIIIVNYYKMSLIWTSRNNVPLLYICHCSCNFNTYPSCIIFHLQTTCFLLTFACKK